MNSKYTAFIPYFLGDHLIIICNNSPMFTKTLFIIFFYLYGFVKGISYAISYISIGATNQPK